MKSSTETKRSKQAAATKKRIFESAMKLLSEYGFDNLTIKDIVEDAGVSVGTFYNYYQSKHELYNSRYAINDKHIIEEIVPLLKGTVPQRILQLFDYSVIDGPKLIGGVEGEKVHYKLDNQFLLTNKLKPTGHFKVLKDLLLEGLENGELVTDQTPEELIDMFMIIYRGYMFDWCVNNGSYDLKQKIHKDMIKILSAYTDLPLE